MLSSFYLGKIHMPYSEDRLAIKSIYGPMVYSNTMEQYIGIVTYNNKMYITISYNAKIINSAEMENITKAFINEISKI